MNPHTSVLLDEVLQGFENCLLDVFFDGTVGAGGHAEAILSHHPEITTYLACDQDEMAQKIAKKRLTTWEKKVDWILGPFSQLKTYLAERKIRSIDGFLIDVGVSSMQLDTKERGFSFRFDGPLDMRMDQTGRLTAAEIVNRWSEKELGRIFLEFGEERFWRKAASAIVDARKRRKIETTKELAELMEKTLRRGDIHPATRVFQALRIVVNDELGELEKGIVAAIDCLRIGGRIAVIAFHSLEDRIVKQAFKKLDVKKKKQEGMLKLITPKPLVPTPEEVKKNPRSRSAKLRIAERVA